MAYYGTDFLVSFNLKTNAPYSIALGTAKISSLANESLVKVVEQIYKNSNSDYLSDNVRAMVSTNIAATVASNAIDTTGITNFNHLLIARCTIQDVTFKPVLTNVLLVDGTYTRIVLSKSSALRSTDQVILTTPISGVFYVKQLSETVYELYTDANLLVPAYNGVPYAGTGTVQRVLQTYAMPLESEEKIGILSKPTIYFPRVQEADNLIKLDAGGSPILSATIDYITSPPLAIDVTDSTDDLLEFYPLELIYRIVDKAAQIFGEITRDPALTQFAIAEQQQNNQVTPQ